MPGRALMDELRTLPARRFSRGAEAWGGPAGRVGGWRACWRGRDLSWCCAAAEFRVMWVWLLMGVRARAFRSRSMPAAMFQEPLRVMMQLGRRLGGMCALVLASGRLAWTSDALEECVPRLMRACHVLSVAGKLACLF